MLRVPIAQKVTKFMSRTKLRRLAFGRLWRQATNLGIGEPRTCNSPMGEFTWKLKSFASLGSPDIQHFLASSFYLTSTEESIPSCAISVAVSSTPLGRRTCPSRTFAASPQLADLRLAQVFKIPGLCRTDENTMGGKWLRSDLPEKTGAAITWRESDLVADARSRDLTALASVDEDERSLTKHVFWGKETRLPSLPSSALRGLAGADSLTTRFHCPRSPFSYVRAARILHGGHVLGSSTLRTPVILCDSHHRRVIAMLNGGESDFVQQLFFRWAWAAALWSAWLPLTGGLVIIGHAITRADTKKTVLILGDDASQGALNIATLTKDPLTSIVGSGAVMIFWPGGDESASVVGLPFHPWLNAQDFANLERHNIDGLKAVGNGYTGGYFDLNVAARSRNASHHTAPSVSCQQACKISSVICPSWRICNGASAAVRDIAAPSDDAVAVDALSCASSCFSVLHQPPLEVISGLVHRFLRPPPTETHVTWHELGGGKDLHAASKFISSLLA